MRVSHKRRCPVCDRPDWCLISADGSACICPRTESGKRAGDAGWLHKLADRDPRPRRPVVRISPATPPPDLSALAASYQQAATADRLRELAGTLGVRPDSLAAFGVGWAADKLAWSFPMTDPATGTITGIRLRPPVGRKYSVVGSRAALFIPTAGVADGGALLILEGESDAIAAHGIGFANVVGRPSCESGRAHLVNLVRSRKPSAVVIVRDNDGPGIRGAESLASLLVLYCRDVRVIGPPEGVKDMRAWVNAGATRADVERVIEAADVRRLAVTLAKGGAR